MVVDIASHAGELLDDDAVLQHERGCVDRIVVVNQYLSLATNVVVVARVLPSPNVGIGCGVVKRPSSIQREVVHAQTMWRVRCPIIQTLCAASIIARTIAVAVTRRL
jgi:hypothetical protein